MGLDIVNNWFIVPQLENDAFMVFTLGFLLSLPDSNCLLLSVTLLSDLMVYFFSVFFPLNWNSWEVHQYITRKLFGDCVFSVHKET